MCDRKRPREVAGGDKDREDHPEENTPDGRPKMEQFSPSTKRVERSRDLSQIPVAISICVATALCAGHTSPVATAPSEWLIWVPACRHNLLACDLCDAHDAAITRSACVPGVPSSENAALGPGLGRSDFLALTLGD